MNQSELRPNEILQTLGVLGVQSVTPVHGGYGTAIWRVEARGTVYALRVFRPEQHAVSRLEAIAMQAAGAAGLSVPHIHAAGDWHGHPAMLISWCEGRPMLQAVLRQPWKTWSIAVSFGRMHARLHRVTAPDEMQARRSNWPEWAGGSGDEALQARLRALPQRHDVLIHLDYHPMNVLMAGATVAAVIDWTNAHAGDPRADVARTLTILRFAPVNRSLQRVLLAPLRRLLAAGWLYGYTREAGPLADMAPFYAWAAAVLRADTVPKFVRPETSGTHPDLASMDRWVAFWRRRISPPL